jgi:pimeloyl-ACP methyl ester carboxylesterase
LLQSDQSTHNLFLKEEEIMDQSPHTSDFVTVNGLRLHYLDWGGHGTALLFLAGRGCNAHIFDDFAPRFTPQFRLLALTRRGCGDSDYPAAGYDIDILVEDIRQFLDILQIDRVILAGHSLAGVELSHFSALYPERVIKLVFLEAAYDYNCPEYTALIEKHPGRKIHIPGADQDYYSIQDYAAFIKYAYPTLGAIWGELMDEHLLHSVEISPEGKVVDKMPDSVDRAISDTLSAYRAEDAQIRAPTLAIYAIKKNTYYISTDYMTPDQQAEMIEFFDNVVQPWNHHSIEQFRRNVPHAKIVEIPGGHHYCFIQQEERVFEEMLSFLLENSPSIS